MSNLFRPKSLERISSPEQLNAYLRVSTPSMWLLLAAIAALLVGVSVWGVFGHMDTTLTAVAVSQDGRVTAYVREGEIARVHLESAVKVDGDLVRLQSISGEPVRVDGTFTEYMRHVGGLQEGEWVYEVTLDASWPDGVYIAQIVIDSVSPMSFVLN